MNGNSLEARRARFTPEMLAKMHAGRKVYTLEERFWPKVDKRGPDECWPWLGSKHEDGYGQLWMDGRVQRAHRASLRVHGIEPPPYDGGSADCIVVDHICRNPGCVNPKHLRFVRQRHNCGLLANNPVGENARKTHCLRGHPLSGENVALVQRVGKRGVLSTTRLCLTCYRAKYPGTKKGSNTKLQKGGASHG